ncbi:nuclear transport factor 2 family protein [Agrococcus jejuensis]|uniref:Uncharacterized protein n=1 Tax=Agrococcus jejuensis TaxID=399736 RepID=A0A1G8EWU6_9MICO|nr:hypothetical protein [Agrococcus jejuensis]SDH74315.1 hypothetical protein SAMN04489720_2223 [Agrococcus jejuensis]
MTERMPDFTMPSDEDLAAERRAEAISRARAADPTSGLRDALGLEQEPLDEAVLADAAGADEADDASGEQGAAALPPPDPSTRIHSRRADRPVRVPSAVRRRVLTIVRNPIVAFATGASVVAAGFLAAPAITAWTERGTMAELERVVDDYVAALNQGDAEAAVAAFRPDEGMGSLALIEAGVAPTSPPTVACGAPTLDRAGDVATARCSLEVMGYGSGGMVTPLRIERVDGSWRLGSSLLQRSYVAPALFELVSVSGVPMAGLLDPDEEAYWLLPGGYDTETRTSDLIDLTDYGGLVVADGGGYLNVMPQVSEAVMDDVEAAALAFAEGCVVDEDAATRCGIVPPPEGRGLSASFSQPGYPHDALTFGIPVRIAGSGEAAAPNVEVLVHFDETWTSYELEVTGVTEMYG